MGKLEARFDEAGLDLALQFIRDIRPARSRVYLCRLAGEIIVRPRVSSSHMDSLLLGGVPEWTMAEAVKVFLEAGVPAECIYSVRQFTWNEEQAAPAKPMASERRMPPPAERTG